MTQTCQQHCGDQEAREPFSSQRTVGSFCQGPPGIRGVAWGNRHKSCYLNLSVIDQPVAAVATPVLVLRASSASSNSIHIPLINSQWYWSKIWYQNFLIQPAMGIFDYLSDTHVAKALLTGCSCLSVRQSRCQPWWGRKVHCKKLYQHLINLYQILFQLKDFLTQTCPRYRRGAHQSPFEQSPANTQIFLSKCQHIYNFWVYSFCLEYFSNMLNTHPPTWIKGDPWKSILSLLWLWFSSATSLLLWLYFSHSFVFLKYKNTKSQKHKNYSPMVKVSRCKFEKQTWFSVSWKCDSWRKCLRHALGLGVPWGKQYWKYAAFSWILEIALKTFICMI